MADVGEAESLRSAATYVRAAQSIAPQIEKLRQESSGNADFQKCWSSR
jgi:hypothetical protein